MSQRRLKIVLGIVATLIGVIVLASILLYSAFVRTLNVSDYASFYDLPVHSWASLHLSDKTRCSDGSDYRIYARRGDSPNLVVYFAGGGACWDEKTCSRPITITDFSGYYYPFIWEIVRASADGILSAENGDNPFRDWNEVYVPYCTGDFDIGQTAATYSPSVTIDHVGQQNVSEALAWVYKTFPQPPKLLISGASAGGFASVFWTPTIAAHYPTSQVYQLGDGVFLKSPKWPHIVNEVWKADTEALGFPVTDDLAGGAYLHYSQTPAPNVTYLHINTVYDGTLLYFNAALNEVPEDAAYFASWSQDLRASTKAIAQSGLNYHYYLTDYGLDTKNGTTPHASITAPLFYQITQDGTTLHDWLRRIVIDGESVSVGANFLN